MALIPKRMKYRKSQRGRIKGHATRGNEVSFGDFGLMSMEQAWVSSRQIEAARVAASHFLAGQGRLWRRCFAHKPISGKPLEVRMGKGKGETEYYAAVIRPGCVMFEVGGTEPDYAKAALARAAHKLPVKCILVKRRPTI